MFFINEACRWQRCVRTVRLQPALPETPANDPLDKLSVKLATKEAQAAPPYVHRPAW
jgi:hypothetical protein